MQIQSNPYFFDVLFDQILPIPAIAMNAMPQKTLQTQPTPNGMSRSCAIPTQKLIQNVPNLPLDDWPMFPQHSRLNAAKIVPKNKTTELSKPKTIKFRRNIYD